MSRPLVGVGSLLLAVALACDAAPDPVVRQTGPYVPPPATPAADPPAVPPVETVDPLVSSPFIVDTGAAPGGRLVFMYSDNFWDGTVRIYSMRPDGTELGPVTPSDVTYAWSPVWSPNDSLIAFATYASGGGSLIWVVNPDGSGKRQVAQGDYPFWLADGRLGYTCSYTDICAIDASGANRTVLLEHSTGVQGFGYTLSPDGALIAFMRQTENETHTYYGFIPYTIWVMRSDGTGARRLTATDSAAAFEVDPSWSRDGKQIAFTSKALGVAVADADGGRLHTVSRHDDIKPSIGGGSPVWSPDGKQVLFGGAGGIFFIANADGSGLIRRVRVPMPPGYAATSWSWGKR